MVPDATPVCAPHRQTCRSLRPSHEPTLGRRAGEPIRAVVPRPARLGRAAGEAGRRPVGSLHRRLERTSHRSTVSPYVRAAPQNGRIRSVIPTPPHARARPRREARARAFVVSADGRCGAAGPRGCVLGVSGAESRGGAVRGLRRVRGGRRRGGGDVPVAVRASGRGGRSCRSRNRRPRCPVRSRRLGAALRGRSGGLLRFRRLRGLGGPVRAVRARCPLRSDGRRQGSRWNGRFRRRGRCPARRTRLRFRARPFGKGSTAAEASGGRRTGPEGRARPGFRRAGHGRILGPGRHHPAAGCARGS